MQLDCRGEGKKKVDLALSDRGCDWNSSFLCLYHRDTHPKGRPYVPQEARPIQIKIERAPTTKGNGMSTTGGDNLIIRGRVTGKVIKLRHFEKNGCKWTGFICLNGLRPRLLQPKEGLLPIRSPHLRRSSRSWAPNYESLLLFHVSKSGLIPYFDQTAPGV